MKHKRSQWMMGLLDAEQHYQEGYSIQNLAKTADELNADGKMSTEAHIGVHDYLWYVKFRKDENNV